MPWGEETFPQSDQLNSVGITLLGFCITPSWVRTIPGPKRSDVRRQYGRRKRQKDANRGVRKDVMIVFGIQLKKSSLRRPKGFGLQRFRKRHRSVLYRATAKPSFA